MENKRVVLIGLECNKFCEWLGHDDDEIENYSQYHITCIGDLPVSLWPTPPRFVETTYKMLRTDKPDCVLLIHSTETLDFANAAAKKLADCNHVVIFVCHDGKNEIDITVDYTHEEDKQKLADYIVKNLANAYTDYDDDDFEVEEEKFLSKSELERILRIKRSHCCNIL